ncbi:MAG: PmoA family protein [Sedimentisphaerales bacterium]|nr:PmoA family protein [Sedimentisphaerales bacterium]
MGKSKSISIIVLLSVVFISVTNQALAENPMRITMDENIVSVHTGQRILMQYNYENVPFKPCVHELFTPGSVNVLRDAPADHLHHHALMYAIAVDGINFWEEQQAPGRQSHRSFTNIRIDKHGDVPGVSFTEQLDWVNPRNQELMLKEQRTIKVCQPDDLKVTLLSWQSCLAVPSGKESVTLSGSHYFGLGMRFVESMDTGGQFRNSEGRTGEIVRGDERITRADWCAYTAKANGKVVTVAMFGHPDNLRHPTHWFTMTKPFAYLSATLNLYREPLKVLSGKPLALRYAVAVWDNRIKEEQIEKVYNWWVNSK